MPDPGLASGGRDRFDKFWITARASVRRTEPRIYVNTTTSQFGANNTLLEPWLQNVQFQTGVAADVCGKCFIEWTDRQGSHSRACSCIIALLPRAIDHLIFFCCFGGVHCLLKGLYLRDDSFQTNKPKLLIWEMPERDMAAPPQTQQPQASTNHRFVGGVVAGTQP